MAEMTGVDPALLPGDADRKPEETAAAETIAATPFAIDPAKQFEILNPKEIELRCEMFYIDWYCGASHVTTADDRPTACSTRECRSTDFQSAERIDVVFFKLKLAFTELQIHRRKVFEHIEHYAQIVFAELLRHHPTANLSGEWLQSHRGYYEAATISPQARGVLRELLAFLNPEQGRMVEGMTDVALSIAAIAVVNCRMERVAEMNQKKAMAGT